MLELDRLSNPAAAMVAVAVAEAMVDGSGKERKMSGERF